MSGKKQEIDSSRRKFLHGSAIAGAGAVVAGSLPAATLADTEPAAEQDASATGYRLTEHVKAYYKAAAS